MLMDGTHHFMSTVCDSLVVDIGIGTGIGFGVEAGGFEGEALVRSDFITFRKDAGKNSLFYHGRAEEKYVSLEGAGCVMESGKNNRNLSYEEKSYPFTQAEVSVVAGRDIYVLKMEVVSRGEFEITVIQKTENDKYFTYW